MVAVGIPPVINPYDENALELALQIKDHWGGKVIALNMSEKATSPILKKALSVGADELIILEDPVFKDLTSFGTAEVLSGGIRKIKSFDLIVTGRQSADWDSGQVGLLIAGILKIPGISLVQKVDMEDGSIIVQRLRRNGYEVMETHLPALVTVSSEAGDLRLPTLKAIQEARKKQVTVWRRGDLGVDPALLRKRAIRAITPPPLMARNCFFIDGQSAEEKVGKLILRLRQDRVV
ncbi:MAG: electron transfer flavoprotein subunit beta/FixA family protein [Deltaproteobacteria bacterium]|nr:electron transfer flavoprotein subunit beta/FixA family protein [Deltaproteobacteria bacterium]